MKKAAFVFPGQGAQYAGMGKDFYENFECAREVFAMAGEALGCPVEDLIFRENGDLHVTKYTQVAILAVELAILSVFQERGLAPSVCAGLSLGEYSALVASGALSLRDALRLIVKRGAIMQEAVPTGGSMVAVMGLSDEEVERICEKTEGIVAVANYNCPGQTVISGEDASVARAVGALKEAGARRCMRLNVSGPFHSPMMEEAGRQLGKELDGTEIREIATPYVANVTAEYVTDRDMVKDLLVRQISSPVRWKQSVERMVGDGVELFVEIGPKKTLTGFLKRIAPEVLSFSVENVGDLENLSLFMSKNSFQNGRMLI